MAKENRLRVLFIGNSHTYYNDMPHLFAEKARSMGYDCEVTMIAHGGWYLAQHVEEPDVKFNILYGNYDYVILQEYAHPFGPEEKFYTAAEKLNEWICEAGIKPILYETWAQKVEPEKQEEMNAAHHRIAEKLGFLFAPVGEYWQAYRAEHPEIEMYASDGAHASPTGSSFAAEILWNTLLADRKPSGE